MKMRRVAERRYADRLRMGEDPDSAARNAIAEALVFEQVWGKTFHKEETLPQEGA